MSTGLRISEISRDEVQKQLVLRIKNSSVEFVNALRRSIMDDVPTVAIDKVTIRCNDSPMHDEMLAHRLGLLPLYIPASRIAELRASGACGRCNGGCDQCQVTLQLSVTNMNDRPLGVTSHDLQCIDYPSILRERPEIPLTRLPLGDPEEERYPKLDLSCVAVKGTGVTHAKWMAGVASYQAIPKITINPDYSTDANAIDTIMGACPRANEIFRKDTTDTTTQIVVLNEDACVLCDECCREHNGVRYVSVVPSETDFIFIVESHSSYTCNELVMAGLDCLDMRRRAVEDGLGREKLTVTPTN